MLFKELNLIEPLLKALSAEGYTHPTPIQEKAIPVVLQKKDLLGCAQTGTGKTAAFALPMLQLLQEKPVQKNTRRNIRALILTPTRELAIQIRESFESYGKFTGIKQTVIFGGVSQGKQVDDLNKGVDVLIATPGRLLDLVSQRLVNLQHIELFVLDEADRMLDMGFVNDVKKIIAKIPVKRQTLFFSATMPDEISHLANTILTNPVRVEVTPVSSTAEKITQAIYSVEKKNKPNLLIHLLQDKSIENVLVFTKTKHGADKLVKILAKANIIAEAIHGNKSQNARQRALTNFKSGDLRVLVATDIAARGIDVDELKNVINFELPNIPETYVHRIGRTGRAGASGTAWSFCDEEERPFLNDILKLTQQEIPLVEDHPYPLYFNKLAVPSSVKKTKSKESFRSSSRKKSFRPKEKPQSFHRKAAS
ncbi:DEAD/DEAH box helicase [Arcticibacter sp.]|uniref:DEAD/DEAH box helicase n=1 Tax=Arcticibacter sp. TaxID=1872630 RepID=UPI00388E793D